MNKKLNRLWETKTKDDEWWSSFVTAPIAIGLNYFVVDWQWLNPNRLTLLSLLTAILSAIFIVLGGASNFIAAAVLIHLSHVFDCMDGQMARYRLSNSAAGCYFDKLSDQIQVTLWFGSIAYAAYAQSLSVVPVFLAFIGVAFYSLRGYAKYVDFHTEMGRDNQHLEKLAKMKLGVDDNASAGLGFSLRKNAWWLLKEQRKILDFKEGVFIFMLSAALLFNVLTPMLWVFAGSQLIYGLARPIQRGRKIDKNLLIEISK